MRKIIALAAALLAAAAAAPATAQSNPPPFRPSNPSTESNPQPVQLRCWDDVTKAWVRCSMAGGGGSSGGASTGTNGSTAPTSSTQAGAVDGAGKAQALRVGPATSAQALVVTSPTDGTAAPVQQSGTWTVQPGNVQNLTPWLTAQSPCTSGVCSLTPVVGVGVSAQVLKNAAGNLFSVRLQNASAAGYLVTINATAAPAANAAITPVICEGVAAPGGTNASAGMDFGLVPERYATGIVALFSTSCTTYTAAGTAIIRGRVN